MIYAYLCLKNMNIKIPRNIILLILAQDNDYALCKHGKLGLLKNIKLIDINNCLFISVRYGHLDIVKYILETCFDGKKPSNLVDYAVKHDQYEIVEYLFNMGCIVDLSTTLYEAVKNQNHKIVKSLLKNSISESFMKQVSLKFAISNNNLKITRILLNDGVDCNDYSGTNLSAAVCNNNYEMVQLLINAGANANVNFGHSLFCAAKNGNFSILRLLIKNGANVHSLNNRSMCVAIQGGHLECIKYLIKKRRAAFIDFNYLRRIASKCEKYDILKYLMPFN